MIKVNLAVEDRLSETVLKVLIEQTRNDIEVLKVWPDLNRLHASSGFGYLKTKLKAFNEASKYTPFWVLTDLDRKNCAPSLIHEWFKDIRKHPNLLFRVAITEVESWVMADRKAFAAFLGITQDLIPTNTDKNDSKNVLFQLARKSKKNEIKKGLLPTDKSASTGPAYNLLLTEFVRQKWDVSRALLHSDSLKRAYLSVKKYRLLPES